MNRCFNRPCRFTTINYRTKYAIEIGEVTKTQWIPEYGELCFLGGNCTNEFLAIQCHETNLNFMTHFTCDLKLSSNETWWELWVLLVGVLWEKVCSFGGGWFVLCYTTFLVYILQFIRFLPNSVYISNVCPFLMVYKIHFSCKKTFWWKPPTSWVTCIWL